MAAQLAVVEAESTPCDDVTDVIVRAPLSDVLDEERRSLA